VELARRELERARDRGHPIDAGQGPELAHEGLAPPRELPDDREQQAVLARVLVWREALREDAALHAEHLGLSRAAAHDDEHSAVYLLGLRRETKKQRSRLCHRPTRPVPGH